MQPLNHHKRPCDSFSFGYAIFILASFIFSTTYADYDCSAKDDGWYYDPDFCHVYWRCTHGTAEEFECASGTAWDHHESRCNWLDSVDCSRAEKTTEKISSAEQDDDGSETSGGGDEEEEQDEKNDNENEDDTSVVVVSKTKRKKKKLSSDKRMLAQDDELSSVIVCQANTTAEAFCAGRDGFFADPDYCTRYYRCAYGVDQGFECPKGTAWDDETKSCAWNDHVNCEQKKLEYSTSTTTTEDTTTSRKKSDTESIVSESSIPSVKPATHGKDSSNIGGVECQPTGIYTVADPSECNAYYQCDKGIRTRLNCAERQLFDADKRQCLEYERVFCGTRSVNLADKNQCVSKRDGVHPDTERDCRFYYQCVGQNKMREAKCPGDQKFSSYTGKCGPAGNAPMPCGTYLPGSAPKQFHQKMALVISIIFFLNFAF